MSQEVQVSTRLDLTEMNKRLYRLLILVFLPVFAIFADLSAADTDVVMDASFFKNFVSVNSIVRDEFIEKKLNSIVIGRGIITDISEKERYKRQYRIIVESSDAPAYGQKFYFYIFIDNRDTFDLLTKNSSFEFKGQLVGYTPLDVKRNEYILDVIFMDGSTIIE